MAVILDFSPTQNAQDKRLVRETAQKLGQVIIFPGVRIERKADASASKMGAGKTDGLKSSD